MTGQRSLQRLVLDYRTGEMIIRCLYRSEASPTPGTVRRRREVTDLVRTGLEQALVALEGDAAVAKLVGTSGSTTREDVLLATTSRDAVKQTRGA